MMKHTHAMVGQSYLFGLSFTPIIKHKSPNFQTQTFKTKCLVIGPLLNDGHEMGVCQWEVCLLAKGVQTLAYVHTLGSLP